jgi:hypothetical protein
MAAFLAADQRHPKTFVPFRSSYDQDLKGRVKAALWFDDSSQLWFAKLSRDRLSDLETIATRP